jgi:DNA modification methylase
VRARDLVPNPKNWRRHPKSQVDALRGLLNEVGFVDALLVRELPDGRLMLIDGHLRAETLPDALLPVLLVDLTEAEADKVLLTLDPISAMAQSDSDRIRALLENVRSDDAAVQNLLHLTAGERLWNTLHPNELNEIDISPERAEELKAKWGTVSGQLWQVGLHRLACGDCRDDTVVKRLWSDSQPHFRMIWTDPPYGVNYGEKTTWMHRCLAQKRRKPIENDDLGPEEIATMFSTALACALPYAQPGAALYATVPAGTLLPVFIAAMQRGGVSYRHSLVWVKQALVLDRADYHYRHELILYGWIENGPHYFTDDRSRDSVFEIDRPIDSPLHPTTKPVELIARMIANSSRPDELVYDPFCGSGSTLVAAHQLGRIAYGCEIDPGYLAVELERLSILGLDPQRVSE